MAPSTRDPLVRHCITNLDDLFDTLSETKAKDGHATGWFRYLRTPGPDGLWPNRIYGLAAPPSDPLPIAQDIVQGMRDRLFPQEINVEQVDDLPRWNTAMEEAGLSLRMQFPSMAVAVNECRQDRATPAMDCTLHRVSTREDLRQWAGLIAMGWWQAEQKYANLLEELYEDFLMPHAALSLWLLRAGDVPVATGMLHITGEVGGVYLIYVDGAFRQKGLGGYITAQMVRLAGQGGCRWAILQATAEGEPVYRRLGFQVVYQNRLYWLKKA